MIVYEYLTLSLTLIHSLRVLLDNALQVVFGDSALGPTVEQHVHQCRIAGGVVRSRHQPSLLEGPAVYLRIGLCQVLLLAGNFPLPAPRGGEEEGGVYA